MEGVLFYWFSWSAWTIVTFLAPKNNQRTLLSFLILVCIALSDKFIYIYDYRVNIAFITIFLVNIGLLRCRTFSSLIYHVFTIMIIGLSYVLLHIYILFDPAIFLVIHPWMLVLPIVVVILFLVRDLKLRLVTLFLGMCIGECLMMVVFTSFDKSFGDLSNLDDMALLGGITATIGVLGKWVNKLRILFERQFPKRISK